MTLNEPPQLEPLREDRLKCMREEFDREKYQQWLNDRTIKVDFWDWIRMTYGDGKPWPWPY